MSEPKYIIESNPHVFLERLIDAVKDGWRVDNTNSGWAMESNGLKEIMLSYDPNRVYNAVGLGEFVVSDYSTQTFLHKLCECVSQGGNVNMDSLNWDLTGIKSVKGTIYLIPKYNKAELAEMEWEELKSVCKELGFTGRDRGVLQSKYLSMTGQLV